MCFSLMGDLIFNVFSALHLVQANSEFLHDEPIGGLSDRRAVDISASYRPEVDLLTMSYESIACGPKDWLERYSCDIL